MSLKPKILFVHNALSTFVRIDRDLLAQEYAIDELYLKNKSQVNPLAIWKRVKANDLVFAWFASWHSFLPLLFAHWQGKPSVLVAGGYDTANVPEAAYGNQRSWFPRLITNATIRLASAVICNSNFTRAETLAATQVTSSKINVVYHGLPSCKQEEEIKKEPWALNVGNLFWENLKRKGVEPFVRAAAYAPNWQFKHAGKWHHAAAASYLQKLAADNAQLLGFVSDTQLENLYKRSTFYVQPSLHEGFGMSVVEAMQRGCVPIISTFGALAEVSEGAGIVLDKISPEAIAEAINQCTSQQIHDLSEKAKELANTKYTLKARQVGLLKVLRAFN
jgi:glycosyltransferase involved in cell wall biosynthesis